MPVGDVDVDPVPEPLTLRVIVSPPPVNVTLPTKLVALVGLKRTTTDWLAPAARENELPDTTLNGAATAVPPDTVELVKAYCQYCVDTYGRFPVYLDPMYQRLTCQAQHVDPDFYERYYPPGAVTRQHTEHFRRWHPEAAGPDGGPPRRRSSPA